MNFQTQATAPMISMLTNLKAWLNTAKQHSIERGFDSNSWLQTRLVVDMLPLIKQVQIACDFAKNSHAKLLQADVPAFSDDEATFEDVIARIDKTLDILNGLNSQNPSSDWENQTIELNLKNGKNLQFTGLDYLNNFAMPAFYFHIMTAYNLLRANGVKLGKADYHGAVMANAIKK